jgi:hypothetical protein
MMAMHSSGTSLHDDLCITSRRGMKKNGGMKRSDEFKGDRSVIRITE